MQTETYEPTTSDDPVLAKFGCGEYVTELYGNRIVRTGPREWSTSRRRESNFPRFVGVTMLALIGVGLMLMWYAGR